jgi:hypothetical protein
VKVKNKNIFRARHQWLMPMILATQEAEIRRPFLKKNLSQKMEWLKV